MCEKLKPKTCGALLSKFFQANALPEANATSHCGGIYFNQFPQIDCKNASPEYETDRSCNCGPEGAMCGSE